MLLQQRQLSITGQIAQQHSGIGSVHQAQLPKPLHHQEKHTTTHTTTHNHKHTHTHTHTNTVDNVLQEVFVAR